MSVTHADLAAGLDRVEARLTRPPNWFARAGVGALVLLLLFFVVSNYRLSQDAKHDRRQATGQIAALATAVRELEAQVRLLCLERADQTTSCTPVTSIPSPVPTPGASPAASSPALPGPGGAPSTPSRRRSGPTSRPPTASTGRGGGTPSSAPRPSTRPSPRPTTAPSPSPSPPPLVTVCAAGVCTPRCVLGICLPGVDLISLRSAFR